MNFELTSSQKALQGEVIAFAKAYLNEGFIERERQALFARDLWLLCGKQKFQGLSVSDTYGGKGLGALDTALAFEALGYGCEDNGLAFAIGAQLFACVIPIWLYGTASQKDAYLPKLCSGELIASNAMTEAQGGSAAFDMQSRATKTQDGYILHGVKTYCANAPLADICIAYLPTHPEKGFFGGISAFLLDKQAFTVDKKIEKLGLRTCQTGVIRLQNVAVDSSALLGKEGAGAIIFTRSMEWERIGLAGWHLGCMKQLLERAVLFAKERKPGGIQLSRHQAISHRLADMQAQLEASKLLVYQAAWKLDNQQNVNFYASIAKLFSSEAYKAMCMELVQIYGGLGYHQEHEASRSLRDAVAATLYSGTSEIQKNIISRGMGLHI